MIFNLSTGYDDDGNGVDKADDHSAWPDAIDACVDQTGLKKVKADMVAKFGGATKIPAALVRAYNAKWEAVKERPHHSRLRAELAGVDGCAARHPDCL
jgi:hypothetical protein